MVCGVERVVGSVGGGVSLACRACGEARAEMPEIVRNSGQAPGPSVPRSGLGRGRGGGSGCRTQALATWRLGDLATGGRLLHPGACRPESVPRHWMWGRTPQRCRFRGVREPTRNNQLAFCLHSVGTKKNILSSQLHVSLCGWLGCRPLNTCKPAVGWPAPPSDLSSVNAALLRQPSPWTDACKDGPGAARN